MQKAIIIGSSSGIGMQLARVMAKGEGLFWVMPLEKATLQIYNALKKKKSEVYVTKRWGFIGFILKRMPKYLYYKM